MNQIKYYGLCLAVLILQACNPTETEQSDAAGLANQSNTSNQQPATGNASQPSSSNNNPAENNAKTESLLRSVSSEQELFDAVISNQPSAVMLDAPVAIAMQVDAAVETSASDSGSNNFSQTYTVEVNVDEADIIKYDGTHLFIASQQLEYTQQQKNNSLTIAEDIQPNIVTQRTDATIRVLKTNSQQAEAEFITNITLEDTGYPRGIYLHNDQLVSINTANYYGVFGDSFIRPYAWYQQNVDLHFLDVSNANNIIKSNRIQIEGGYVQSRRIGDMLYIVTRHSPYGGYPILFAEPVVDDAIAVSNTNTESTASDLDPKDIIPALRLNDQTYDLFSYEDCYIKNQAADSDGNIGSSVITSITAISLNNPSQFHTSCYNQETSGVYVSENAVYLFEPQYAQRTQTIVHKFALSNQKSLYSGSGVVRGQAWLGGQRDFRASEHNGYLRLITTEYTGESGDREDHYLSILSEDSDKRALSLVSTLPNKKYSAELGKPNESLYGVRFFGERAYLVTFERIDPLYILDLSNPEDPFIAGQLEIPGVSDFLHPVNEDLLLAFGRASQDRNSALKLELFDVSNIASPLSLNVELVGEDFSYTSSPVLYDRHAFSYLKVDEQIDKFTLPISYNEMVLEQDDNGKVVQSYRYVQALKFYELRDKDQAVLSSIQEIGTIRPDREGGRQSSAERSVLHNDALYYISDDKVWSVLWDSPQIQFGPQ